MALSIIGQVATPKGLIQQYDLAGNADAWTLPAVAYERAQRRVPILMDHDESWSVGEVAYYERSKIDGLMMVGTIRDDMDDLLDDGDWHLSPAVASRRCGPCEYGQGKISELSLCRRTASLGTRPVCYARHDSFGGGGAPRGLPTSWHETWERAHEAISRDRYAHRRDDALRIVDVDELSIFDEWRTDRDAARSRLQSELDKRRAAKRKLRADCPVESQRVFRHAFPGAALRLVGEDA
jgi:hypothetical protein